MKVLHINQSDILGGASISGYRLHQQLLIQGFDSSLLVSERKVEDDRVAQIPYRWFQSNLLLPFTHRLDYQFLQFTGTFDIQRHSFYQTADVLNFHNLHSGIFSYLALPALTKNKPSVWTLHDMWAFTGHCSYSYDCERWKIGCGQCPYPESYPEIRRDTTRHVWKIKERVYHRSNLTVVAPSCWLVKQAERSLLNCFPIHYIPNGIDVDIYRPLDKKDCRNKLDIPQAKHVLLFGAQRLNDFRKGSDLLLKVLNGLPNTLKQECLLVSLGNESDVFSQTSGIETLNLGYVSSDQAKAIVYSAADLFLFPTRADNLPLMLQESMACGTPMISFNVGGVPDLVRPDITGYLASSEDVEDFRMGIFKLLEDQKRRRVMEENCRKVAVNEYSLDLQVKRYLELYNKIVKTSNTKS